MFKFPKKNSFQELTGEHWAEKLASDIAKTIGIECATVDIGIFNGRIGSMGYLIPNDNEQLIEGLQYIIRKYPNYDDDNFYDSSAKSYYSIEMIVNALEDDKLISKFMEIPVFDCLIGNCDRHHSNWGVIKNLKTSKVKISPLYDNGSSLCCYVNEKDIESFFKDKTRFKAQVYTKSKSRIRWSTSDVKEPRQFDLLSKISQNYYEYTYNIVKKIKTNLKEEHILEILNKYPEHIISNARKKLLKNYLSARIDEIVKIYNL